MADVKIRILGENQAKGALSEVDQQLGGMKNALSAVTDTVMKTTAAVVGIGAAMDKAFEIGKQGAAVQQTEESFNRLIQVTGAASDTLDQLRKSSSGTVDDMTLMSSTLALAAGAEGKFAQELVNSTPQLLEMAKAANKLNPTLGDTAYMYESIALGIKRGSPMILDNLGITVRLEEANQKYADALGKTVEELTSTEQKQALLNEVLDKGNILLDQAGGAAGAAVDPFTRLEASTKNLTDQLKAALVPVLADAAGALETLLTASSKINAAYDEQISKTFEASNSYAEYRAELDRLAALQGGFINETGDLVTEMSDMGEIYEVVKKSQFAYTEETYNAIKAGKAANATYDGVAGAMAQVNVTTEAAVLAKQRMIDAEVEANKEAEKTEERLKKNAEAYTKMTEAMAKVGIEAGLNAEVSKIWENFTEKTADLAEENEKLKGEIVDLVSEGVDPASKQIAELTKKMTANAAEQAKLQEAAQLATKELIYEKAAAYMTDGAALELARTMGLLSEENYSVISQTLALTRALDTTKDGIIGAAEITDEYSAALLKLAEDQTVAGAAIADTTVDLTGVTEGLRQAADQAYRLQQTQDLLSAAMAGELTATTVNYTKTMAELVAESAKLQENYNQMKSGEIPGTADELELLNQQIMDNTAAQAAQVEQMKKATAELIFQKAAQGLDADAALYLAEQMGLISEQDYALMKTIQELQAAFDANRDGMISAAEGAYKYADAIQAVYEKTSALMQLQGASTATASTGYQEGIYTFGGPNGGSVSVPQSVSVNVSYQPLGAGDAYELQQALTPIVQGIVGGG